MTSFTRGIRLGAGLVTLGWGIYRLSGGRRDWTTTASLTAGASMVLSNATDGRPLRMINRVGGALRAVSAATGAVMTVLR